MSNNKIDAFEGLGYETYEPVACERCGHKAIRFNLVPREIKGIKNGVVCSNCYKDVMKEFLS